MRISRDAIEQSNNKGLRKAVKNAEEDGRKTIRSEDFN